MQPCILSDHLTMKRGEKTVLDNLSFKLEAGRLLALIGHNGAGKSTLIKLILGLIKPVSGTLTVLGGEPGSRPLDVGYLPENVSFYDQMTVEEHLRYFAGLKGIGASRVAELVDELGLDVVYRQKLGRCSKGQRQRLGLAQALLSKPRLLMLDEPTVGLDPAATALMYRELSHLRDEGCSIVVCTHELALIEPYLDRVLMLSGGRCRGFGTLDELRRRASLPVFISQFADDRVLSDERLSRYRRRDTLMVPENELTAAMRIVTGDYGLYDCQVRKADLGMIFAHFVLNLPVEDLA